MNKTIEEQVEEIIWDEAGDFAPQAEVMFKKDVIKALQERDRIAYERGHADALRTIPVYETDNITSDK